MPMLLEHIDAIARKKKRDVLFVTFEPAESHDAMKPGDEGYDPFTRIFFDWEKHPSRRKIIKWLGGNGIEWHPCAHFANPNIMIPYMGQIYIDVPYDRNLPEYRKLEAFLETPDGSMRQPNANFCYCPLESAMKNAEHDEPGFWDRWAESF